MTHVYKLTAKKVYEKTYQVTCPYCLLTHVHTFTDREAKMLMGVLPYGMDDEYVYRKVDACGEYEIVEIDE